MTEVTRNGFRFSWPLLVALLTLFGVLASLAPEALLTDPDTYWHIAAGRWMMEHGVVPSTDPFSHTMSGAPWVVQSWLSELVLVTTFRLGGWAALVALSAVCFALTLAGMTRFLLARMEPVHALLFVGLAAGMLLTHLSVRPHVLTWPLMALWVGAQVNASEAQRDPPWWVLPAMWVWANLHGGFTLGLALSGGLALDAVAAHPSQARRAMAVRWFAFVALAAVVSMMTPLGWRGIWYTIEVMQQGYAQSTIVEWKSPDFHQLQGLEIWLLLVLAMGCSGRIQMPLTRTLLLLGLVHLALTSVRSISMLGLVAPFLLARPLAAHWRTRGTLGGAPDVDRLDRWFRALAAPARPALAAVSFAITLAMLCSLLVSRHPRPLRERTPELALLAARAAGVQGEVLNDYGYGGYLIFQGVRVFIDGRSDLYGDAFMKRYVDVLLLKSGNPLSPFLDQYRVGWTLLLPDTPAVALLDRLPDWRRVYADDLAVVHMRVTADQSK